MEGTFSAADYAEAVRFHEGLPGPIYRKRAKGYALRGRRRFGGLCSADTAAIL
jgi:hypothetical protein